MKPYQGSPVRRIPTWAASGDRPERRPVPATERQSYSSVDDESKALVLEADELANRGRNQQAIRNEMSLDFCHDLLHGLLICILLTGGDLTGLPMNRLVSYEEQNAAALQTFDAGV